VVYLNVIAPAVNSPMEPILIETPREVSLRQPAQLQDRAVIVNAASSPPRQATLEQSRGRSRARRLSALSASGMASAGDYGPANVEASGVDNDLHSATDATDSDERQNSPRSRRSQSLPRSFPVRLD
jgi:hypothetical protein